MVKFDETKLLDTINAYYNSPSIATVKLDDTLDEYIAELYEYCREEKNIAERIRTLNYHRGKFTACMEGTTHTPKKCAVIRIIIKRAISSIDSELLLVKMDLEHPERFIEFPSNPQPLARWNGATIELIEYFMPLQIAGKLLLPSGQVMKYADLIRLLESMLGITIAAPQDRKSDVVNRNKPTVFIEKMLDVLRNVVKKSHQ